MSLDELACRYAAAADSGGDVDVHRDQLWRRALPMADRLAGSFAHRGEPIDDLRQVARLGRTCTFPAASKS